MSALFLASAELSTHADPTEIPGSTTKPPTTTTTTTTTTARPEHDEQAQQPGDAAATQRRVRPSDFPDYAAYQAANQKIYTVLTAGHWLEAERRAHLAAAWRQPETMEDWVRRHGPLDEWGNVAYADACVAVDGDALFVFADVALALGPIGPPVAALLPPIPSPSSPGPATVPASPAAPAPPAPPAADAPPDAEEMARRQRKAWAKREREKAAAAAIDRQGVERADRCRGCARAEKRCVVQDPNGETHTTGRGAAVRRAKCSECIRSHIKCEA